MKTKIYTFILFLLYITSFSGQNRYFSAKGILDRTEELSGKNIWISLNNKEKIDGYTRINDSIFGGEIACNVKPLQNIDILSFKVLAGTDYAKDKNHVYFPLEVPCVDYSDCGVCYYSKIIIDNADPETFEYLDKDYASDGKLVFFRGKLLQNADAKTFKVINGPEYFYFATDKNHVYKHSEIFKNADPVTFYYDNTTDNSYIIGDKNNKWKYIPPDQIIKIDKK